MKFAKIVFYFAGITGLIMLVPQYFLEEKNNLDFPPAITHPEHYYGFIGVAVACQILFLIIARDPVRFRPAMLAAIVEKFSFAIAVVVLFAQNRVHPFVLGLSMMDLALGSLFIAAYFLTPKNYAENLK